MQIGDKLLVVFQSKTSTMYYPPNGEHLILAITKIGSAWTHLEDVTGIKEWWLNGQQITEDEHANQMFIKWCTTKVEYTG